MTTGRDPAFWRRFSMAVHQDEEKADIPDSRSASTSSSKPALKQTDSWLERNRRKQRRTRIFGWIIGIGFLVAIAALVLVLLWAAKVGPFDEKSS